ncbi:putative iron export permease protein FetB [Vibrio marisflavi CECT 7928]|uniref:Iron export permease protein FetB n=2 Tax=Vibrio marisflavi TaxID=1216040 RepID=A0ABN8E4N4_9VIBR|nr:putative iron export permease protein FetB [Vibrio marisflavi CECT 7928]
MIDITWWQLVLVATTLLIPIAISNQLKLMLNKDIMISVIRMSLQLILVGLYLEYLFRVNSFFVNAGWLLIMILVGSSSIIGKSQLPKAKLFLPVSLGLFVALLPMLALICTAVVRPLPFYSAQYVIPLAGMLLGNSLSGNIVALQNLFTSLEERKPEYEAAISLGASTSYATRPFIQAALQKSLAPILASMTTTGLVTLPGMMTGQILSGASPMLAIKYQLMIMIAIFVTMSVSITLSLKLTVLRTIHKGGKVTVRFKIP